MGFNAFDGVQSRLSLGTKYEQDGIGVKILDGLTGFSRFDLQWIVAYGVQQFLYGVVGFILLKECNRLRGLLPG